MQLLAGLRILESRSRAAPLHLRIACAMAGKCFAEMGADVLVASPPDRDPLRDAHPLLTSGDSALYTFLGAGKTLLATPGEPHDFDIATLAGSRPFDLAILPAGDPSIVRCRGAGIPIVEIATWPAELEAENAARPVGEHQLMAIGGLLDLVGHPDREPLRLPGHQLSYAAGFSAFTAGMAALMRPVASFEARVSLVETAAWINWKAVVGAATGMPATRRGPAADFQVLPCRDGWVAFIYTPSQFDRVRAMLNDPAADAPCFATRADRSKNIVALTALVGRWFAARTRDEIYAEARANGVALGPVYAPAELLDDIQYCARDFFVAPPGMARATARMPRLPASIDGHRLIGVSAGYPAPEPMGSAA